MKAHYSKIFSFITALLLSVVIASSAFAVDSGPLDIGTRLLIQQQPIIQTLNANYQPRVRANEIDEELDLTSGASFNFSGSSSSEKLSYHTALMGGALITKDDGTVFDDRFLFSAAISVNGRMSFRRIDSSGTIYNTDTHSEITYKNGTHSCRLDFPSMDSAASDWNDDGYPDFAIIYLTVNDDDRRQATLVIVDGKPDENGNFTSYTDSSWKWTLQDVSSPAFSQVRIATGDLDNDGRDEIAIHLGNQKLGGDKYQNLLAIYNIDKDLQLGSGATANCGETKKNWDALDVTVGDFRGTLKKQIATLSSNKGDIYAKIWELQNGSLTKVSNLGNVGKIPQTDYIPQGYLRCAAGDLNGDGRDELVWAGCDSGSDRIAVVVHTNTDTTGGLSFSKLTAQWPLETNKKHPVFDLALGYFSEGFIPSDTTYPNKMQIALAARRDDQVKYRLLSWDGANFHAGTESTSVSVYDQKYVGYYTSSCHDYPVIAPGDIMKQTLSLGDPEHYQVMHQLSPIVVMQATPRHWDSINSQDYDAFSAYDGYATSFYLEENSSETTESSSTSSVSMTTKESASTELSFFTIMGTKLSAAFTHSKTDTEESLSKYTQSSSMKLTADANTDDWLCYTFQNLEIWRYPLLGQAGETVSGDTTTDELYYQVIYPSKLKTQMSGGRDKEWYSPIHENLNILSYPNAVGYISDYPLPGSDNILYGGENSEISVTVGAEVAMTKDNKFSDKISGQEKESHQVKNTIDGSENISVKIMKNKGGITATQKRDSAYTDTSTNSVSLSTTKGFTVSVPKGSGYIFKDGRSASTAKFNLYETAYFSEGQKTLTSAYAVDLIGAGGSLWTGTASESPYRKLPDPALNLPQKWTPITTTNPYGIKKTEWLLSEPEKDRKKLRGAFAYHPDETGSYDSSDPERLLVMDNPSEIKLKSRIYNYSFVPTGPVEVKFSYSSGGTGSIPTEGTPQTIGTVTLENIPAWTRTGPPNWVMAETTWTLKEDLSQGCYWIHVNLDPDGKVAEIHDTGDEAGNNEGWFQIGLVKEETLNNLAEYIISGNTVTAGIVNKTKTDVKNISLVMTSPDAGEGDRTLLKAEIANGGDKPMALVNVNFFEGVAGKWNLFDEEIVPLLLSGETRKMEIPFTPSSSRSDVKMEINPYMGESSFSNNTAMIKRSSDGGCSITTFPALILVLPLLGLLKR